MILKAISQLLMEKKSRILKFKHQNFDVEILEEDNFVHMAGYAHFNVALLLVQNCPCLFSTCAVEDKCAH